MWRFNPLLRGARVATASSWAMVISFSVLQSPTSRGTRCNYQKRVVGTSAYWLQSPTSRGTRCNAPDRPDRSPASGCFNPLLRGARVATSATGIKVTEDMALTALQSPTSRGTRCNASSADDLAGAPLATSFNPLLRGARVATPPRPPPSRPTRCFNPLLRGARVATGCYFEDVSIKLTLQSPTSRGTRCNPPASAPRAR